MGTELVWTELAKLAGDCDGRKFHILNVLYLSEMSNRWLKSAQDAHATEELHRDIEKLDAARKEILRQAGFAIASLGVGFAVNLALLANAGQSVSPLLTGGIQLWTRSGTALGAAPAIMAPARLGGQVALGVAINPLYAAGYTLEQLLGVAAASFAVFAAAKVDSSPKPGLPQMLTTERARAALTDYQKAMEEAIRRGFKDFPDQPLATLLSAAANGKLGDLREKIDQDLDRVLKAQAATRTQSERYLMKYGALVDIWYSAWQGCEKKLPDLRAKLRLAHQALLDAARKASNGAPETALRMAPGLGYIQSSGLAFLKTGYEDVMNPYVNPFSRMAKSGQQTARRP